MTREEFEDKLVTLVSEYLDNHEDEEIDTEEANVYNVCYQDEKIEVDIELTFEITKEL